MTAARRLEHHFGLQRAAWWARQLDRPLLVLEPLRCAYPWATARAQRFVLDGMAEHAARLAGGPIAYWPYVEPAAGAGKGLVAALAAQSAVVVTDAHPGFFFPRLLDAAARQVDTRLEAVDSVGLLPLAAVEKTWLRAFDFRRFLQRELRPHLEQSPAADPLADRALPAHPGVDAALRRRWPSADLATLATPAGLRALPVDHDVPPVAARGGSDAARAVLATFFRERLAGYAERRKHPGGGSGLSPWLHFGHLSSHEILARLVAHEGAHLDDLGRGPADAWWGLSPAGEAFLDELVTWRELAHAFAHREPGYREYDALPRWARATLARHATDPRDPLYDLDALERAATHDEIWNASQRQLRGEGVIDNVLRMLWGKKILEWTRTPQEAHRVMVQLNNRWAVDGRDPNSYAGIGWTLGRFDRAWGPERPIFGLVRYMSSASTRRKMVLAGYLRRWAPDEPAGGLYLRRV